MRGVLLFSLLLAASCTAPRQGGGGASTSSGGAASGSTSSRGRTSSGGGNSSRGSSSSGGSSTGGAACTTTAHCIASYVWTVDCDGRVDGGPCPVDTTCNAASTACISGRDQPCTTDADCDCQTVCGSAGTCVPGNNVPANPCTSDLGCGPICEGLTCVDGGCEALFCGPATCTPGCFCEAWGVCKCPPLPDAGATCVSYFEGSECNSSPCVVSLPDGGCGCLPGTGVLDAQQWCVPCLEDSDCDGGLHCDLDPNSFENYETCVPCTAPGQCGTGSVCDTSRNLCVPDCRLDAGACDAGCSQSGVCGECTSDSDCNPGSVCVAWPDGGPNYGIPPTCRLRCAGDAGCSSLHPVCDPALGYCVDCLQDLDCLACTPPRASCASDFCLTAITCY